MGRYYPNCRHLGEDTCHLGRAPHIKRPLGRWPYYPDFRHLGGDTCHLGRANVNHYDDDVDHHDDDDDADDTAAEKYHLTTFHTDRVLGYGALEVSRRSEA